MQRLDGGEKFFHRHFEGDVVVLERGEIVEDDNRLGTEEGEERSVGVGFFAGQKKREWTLSIDFCPIGS